MASNKSGKSKIIVSDDDTSKCALNTVKLNANMKFMEVLYKLANQLNAQSPKDPSLLSSFKVRLRDVDIYRTNFQDAYDFLQVMSTEESFKVELEKQYDVFYDKYYSVQILNDLVTQETQQSLNQTQTHVVHKSSNFVLPKITLPKFSGVYTEWPNFIAMYESLVHDNIELPCVQKMHYLLSVLDKEPLNLIKHLELSDGNYYIAYNLLKDRYQNKRLIADKHLEAILNITINQNQLNNNLRKFVNTLKENIQALDALGFQTDSWSFILLHILLRKLPVDLRSKFELDHHRETSNDIPTFNKLLEFLETQLKVLEAVMGSRSTSHCSSNNNTHANNSKSFMVKLSYTCYCCKGEHSIYTCHKFNSMTPADRKKFVIDNKLCFNCLRTHSVHKCQSKSCCQICRGRHHTKLHISDNTCMSQDSTIQPETTVSTLSSTVQPSLIHNIHGGSTILLGTAVVGVRDANNALYKVRALIDSGSQVTIVTETLARKLQLPRSNPTTLFGLGESSGQRTNGSIQCVIESLMDPSCSALVTTAVILKRITGVLPSTHVSQEVVSKCRDIRLADDNFFVPGPIDILIGVELYEQIFNGRKLSLGDGFPSAHSSIFGWVLMGRAPSDSDNSDQAVSMSCTVDLDSILTKFWEVEEVPAQSIQDPDDVLCEKHFVETHSRNDNGRFIVRLPFKPGRMPLGSTFENALKRFGGLERKLSKDSRLKELYIEFMRDYLQAGHMRPIFSNISHDRYYIPHHGVLKESSSTTKLRAVFDASALSSSGVSLNQVLMSGPKLQQHVEDVILRFRTHAIVFTCDIKQMYRQVQLHDDDCKYQTIFWRESPELPIQQFELTTVTYGVTSAAYLAMRVLHELAFLNAGQYPAAAEALIHDTFVDDIITGADDVPSAKLLQQQLVDVLAQGGFQLRKWASNSAEVLATYPADHLEKPLRFESGDNIFKVLGVEWNSDSDSFVYQVSNLSKCRTKRDILSNIARIYDPCGYLAPVTFYAKVLMQRVCALRLSWDDQLPDDIIKLWDSFADTFTLLKLPQIPRYILTTNTYSCDVMGFCDASESGYAAVIYLRVQHSLGEVSLHLLRDRSRVAPLRQKLTIPRLELCGALLLARLISHYMGLFKGKISISGVTAWCDSTIVLAWLRSPPFKLQTFEGNRVSQVQGLLPSARWRYVPSASNPADCASRGVTADILVGHSLWWSPLWLKDDSSTWPTTPCVDALVLPGLKHDAVSSLAAVKVNHLEHALITRYSSLSRLQRVTAWLLRFVHNARSANSPTKGPLTVQEINNSLSTLVMLVQDDVFADHKSVISKGRSLSGPLQRLDPFIDAKGLLRVGGRLKHSNLSHDVKHPLLLPKCHHFTNLIIDYYHALHFHAGPSILVNILRQKFWILSARRVVRNRVFQCHRCYRLKAKPLEPLMGNLPASRVRLSHPFNRVGVDFAGPFIIKVSNMRKAKTLKAYLCVFVCFAVKAVHFEVTSDLTTQAFMACFHRFVARRGVPSDVYSDCGKNFQGAANFLKGQQLGNSLTQLGVTWHMNPPYAPHMGGLWESTVKSAKQLLLRTVGEQVLTFEELSTVFARAEAVLNSRPLCPLTDNVSSLEALTPGHYLIGQPLVSLPEEATDDTLVSPLKRWKLVQQISHHFWKRWQGEYLHNLQQRTKWCKNIPNLQLGDLVIIKDDNTTPLRWRKGRVSALHPGKDGITRVVQIKTGLGSCIRSVAKVCPLPRCDSNQQI